MQRNSSYFFMAANERELLVYTLLLCDDVCQYTLVYNNNYYSVTCHTVQD